MTSSNEFQEAGCSLYTQAKPHLLRAADGPKLCQEPEKSRLNSWTLDKFTLYGGYCL